MLPWFMWTLCIPSFVLNRSPEDVNDSPLVDCLMDFRHRDIDNVIVWTSNIVAKNPTGIHVKEIAPDVIKP